MPTSMVRKVNALTFERAHQVLRYDAETGNFWWKIAISRRCSLTRPAGNSMHNGYWRVTVDGCPYMAHRLAIFMMTGHWPLIDVDHRNGQRSDNRYANLRNADRTQNQGNRIGHSRNGYLKGTYKKGNKWIARIMTAYKHRYLGSFSTEQEAHAAYLKAASEHFGEFASPG